MSDDTESGDVALDAKSAKGWAIVKSDPRQSGTYFTLNIRRAAKDGGAFMVKARMDGTYLCLAHECLSAGNALWRPGADNKRVCAHARFVADHDPAVERATRHGSDGAPAFTDDDAPIDAMPRDRANAPTTDSEPLLDDNADALL